jgi:hypothetical protein
MEVKYVPSQCEGEGAIFSGHVVIRKLTREEFYKATKEVQKREGEDSMDLAFRLTEWARKYIVAVEIKHNFEGTEYKSYEDLNSDAECEELIQDVAEAIFLGPSRKKRQRALALPPQTGVEQSISR